MVATMFDYTGLDFAVRPDLSLAFVEVWQQLGQAGTWWSGDDRVALVAEIRRAADCESCTQRAAALSPTAVSCAPSSPCNLPSVAIDAVHRIVNDASRLSRSWLESNYQSSFTDGHYVELLGLVVAVVSIDSFHQALGVPLAPLPVPAAGQPSGYRPPGAKANGAWVNTVAPVDVSEAEADIYGGANQTGNVISAMSLVPDSVRMLVCLSNAQYLPMHDVPNPQANGGRALDRAQIELLAGRVSAINECFY